MSFELTVVNPSGNSVRVPLDVFPFTIGRHSDNHIILRDSRVSRRHAQLTRESGSLFIEDLESLHGIRVNGVKANRAALRNGDTIDFNLEDGYKILVNEKSEAEIRKLLDRLPGASQSSSELSKLRALTEVARSLEHSLSTHDVLATVIEAALTVTGAERGFLLLEDDNTLKVELGRDSSGRILSTDSLPVPAALIRRALRERKELLSFQFDPMADWSNRFNESLGTLDLRSVLCVPLLRLRGNVNSSDTLAATMDDTIGVIYMDSRLDSVSNDQGNRELLQTLALEASTILENARLLEAERLRQRLEQELALARTIQSNLLPKQLPTTGFLHAVGSSIPTHQVGGDFFDVLRLPDGGWLAAVADVSGKGVGAALLASLLQGVLLQAASSGTPLEDWIPRLNRFLLERTEGEKYSTIFACHIHPDGRLRYLNAGHSHPFLIVPGGPEIQVLEANGFPVGLLEQATFEVHETRLAPGSRLVIFSDGVEEARRGPREFFGRERIAASLMASSTGTLDQQHDALRTALTSYLNGVTPHDDATLLLLEYSA